MKAQVLFDETGKVIAMHHPTAEKGFGVAFRPTGKQRCEMLDIPKELRHLKPRALHDSVRVELRGGAAHLVSKAA